MMSPSLTFRLRRYPLEDGRGSEARLLRSIFRWVSGAGAAVAFRSGRDDDDGGECLFPDIDGDDEDDPFLPLMGPATRNISSSMVILEQRLVPEPTARIVLGTLMGEILRCGKSPSFDLDPIR